MKKNKPRWRRWLNIGIKAFLIHTLFSFILAFNSYFRQGEVFVGSPPSQGVKRNNLDLSYRGIWWEKFFKQFRPHGYFEFGPALLTVPIWHFFGGWDVYKKNICVEGQITELKISKGDGDIYMLVRLKAEYAHYSWRKNNPKDKINGRNILVVEIDEPLRENFFILPDLALGDTIKVCGRWVYDRPHNHNEIHPARWMEILQKAGE